MKKGNLYIIVGLLLIAAALFLTGYNYWDNQHASTASVAALDELVAQIQENPAPVPTAMPAVTVSPQPDSSDENEQPDEDERFSAPPGPAEEPQMPVVYAAGGNYIGILSIPVLERTLPIFDEVTNTNLKIAPCLYAGSAYQGNMVICAHNYNSHFGTLKYLQAGDEVMFTDTAGTVFHYTVSEVETLQPTDVDKMLSADCDLTLFTCTIGGWSRVTVRCVKAADGAEPAPAA